MLLRTTVVKSVVLGLGYSNVTNLRSSIDGVWGWLGTHRELLDVHLRPVTSILSAK